MSFALLLLLSIVSSSKADGVLGDEEALSFREYGKNGIKLLYLNDKDKHHQVVEITVKTRLVNDNEDEYTGTSNGGNVATDTQKNLVYILALKHGVGEPEIFAQVLADFYLEEYPAISRAKIEIVQTPWARSLDGFGIIHTHGFVNQGQERTAKVIKHRGKPAQRRAQVSVLCRNRALQFVEMAWPNKHYFPWDLDNFPTLNLNGTDHRRVYIAGVVPYGVIHSGVHRNEVTC